MAASTNRTVNRALDIITLVAKNNEEGLTFSDISSMLEIPKGTLHPILGSLMQYRILHLNVQKRRYFLGEELFNLGNYFSNRTNILPVIDRVMEQAVKRTGFTSFFAVLAGNEVRYLLQRVANAGLQVVASPTFGLKAHCSALGKAMLLDLNREELHRLFPDGLAVMTEHTVTDVDVLYDQLAEMHRDGIAKEREESSPHVQCVAAPIRYDGNIIAAVSISFPVWIDAPEELSVIRQALLEEKREIEEIVRQNSQAWIYSELK